MLGDLNQVKKILFPDSNILKSICKNNNKGKDCCDIREFVVPEFCMVPKETEIISTLESWKNGALGIGKMWKAVSVLRFSRESESVISQ